MIRYSLTCPQDHAFESWFQSSAAFDGLVSAGHVACPICGTTKVEKTLMAPAVQQGKQAAPLRQPSDGSSKAAELERALAELRRNVEENSDYVGMNFAAEARAMHDGDMPERAIYGEVKADEARRLLEDGVPVAPLPFLPSRKTN